MKRQGKEEEKDGESRDNLLPMMSVGQMPLLLTYNNGNNNWMRCWKMWDIGRVMIGYECRPLYDGLVNHVTTG